MAYTLPNFNLLIDVWFPGNTPAGGGADVFGIPAQYYVNSRIPASVDRDATTFFKQQLSFRMPDSWLGIIAIGGIISSTDATPVVGWYFKITDLWKQHPGFPNHYLVAIVGYCDAAGNVVP